MSSRILSRQPFTVLTLIAMLAGLYFVTGLLGLMLAIPPGYATVFWPPAGIALALVYYKGYRLLPGVFIGSALLNVYNGINHVDVTGPTILAINAISIAAGSTLQVYVGTYLINRFVGRDERLERLSRIVRFIVFSGPVSCLVACTWGVLTLLSTKTLSPEGALFSWATWYTGDMLGNLVFGPGIVLALNMKVTRSRKIATALPMFTLFVAVMIFFSLIRQWDTRHLIDTFDQNSMLIDDSFSREISTYQQALQAVQSFYVASHNVERLEFRLFVKRALEDNPGIRGMSWNPRVTDGQRKAFEEGVRKEGFPDFSIKEKTPAGLVIARARPEYFPLDFVEPFDQDRRKNLGFDTSSEAVRRETLERARDSGDIIGSERLRFLNEKEDNQYGFLLAIPLYNGNTDSREQRHNNIKGFLIGGYRFKDIIDPIARPWRARGFELRLLDENPKGEVILYSTLAKGAIDQEKLNPANFAFRNIKDLSLFGQNWRVETYQTESYLESHINWAIWVTLAGGILAVGLSGIFLLYMTGRSVEIEQVVQERTSQLKRQRQFLELAMAATRDGVWDWDEERKSLWLSPRWKAMLGYDDNEIPNSLAGAESVIHPQDLPLWRQRMTFYMTGQIPDFQQVYRFFNKDGSLRYILSRAMCERNEAGRVMRIVGAHTDITEIEQAKQELEKARDAANSANHAKGEFLANMSHEIRTPMNGVIGMTHLLLETSLDNRQRHYAQTIGYSAGALLQLINDILDFSKIEAGKLEIESIPFDLQQLCEEVSELMYVRTREKGVEFLLSWDLRCPTQLRGDPGRLRQILFNLCGNAIKFTEQGQVVLEITSKNVTDGNASIRIAVKDSGIGIPIGKQQLIFNKFDQADTSTTRKYGGTGLGLAISRELVTIMGGDIELDSEPGIGSNFYFTLNFPRAGEADIIPHRMANIPAFDGAGLRALVVENNPLAAEILGKYLTQTGMKTVFETDPEKILATLLDAEKKGEPFACAIIDYPMAGTDVLAIAAEMRRRPELVDCCPVLTAAHQGYNDTEAIRNAGVRGYLTKPLLPSEISGVLGTLCQAKREGRAIDVVTRYTIGETIGKRPGKPVRPMYRDVTALLAEDNQTNQEVLTAMLERYGIRSVVANDGREAVHQMRQRSYDIVLMDCQMPLMDGYEATRTIRKEKGGQETVIIALTANVMKGDREKCLAAGMNDYLSKPVDDRELEEMLIKWLPEAKRSGQEAGTGETTSSPSPSSVPKELDAVMIDKLRMLAGPKFNSILDTFRANATRLMSAIDTAWEQQDSDGLLRAAHSLKSSAGQLGARDLQAVMGLIELRAGEGDLTGVAPLYDEAKAQFPKVMSALEKLTS